MAGSYLHVVGDDGALLSNERVNGMLENGGDVFEAVEEMYGMIWFLASALSGTYPHNMLGSPDAIVEEARKNYKIGLAVSPTQRYKES
jgi:hypothetical protein